MGALTRTQPTDPHLPTPLPAVPPPTPRQKGDGEKAVLGCLVSGQQQCREIGRIIGRGASDVRRTMGKLVRMGAAVEVAPSCYAATAVAHALVDECAGSSRVILAFLAVPRRMGEIARHTGVPSGTVRGRVDMLVCTGQAAKLGRGLYVATGRRRVVPDLPAAPPAAPFPWRAQPIRDAILAFLVEPRQVQDVAAPIGRPVSNAASHLAAMQRRGLVVRTAHGRYERVEPMLELVRLAATAGAWAGSGHVDSDVSAAASPTPISAGGTELPRAP